MGRRRSRKQGWRVVAGSNHCRARWFAFGDFVSTAAEKSPAYANVSDPRAAGEESTTMKHVIPRNREISDPSLDEIINSGSLLDDKAGKPAGHGIIVYRGSNPRLP